MSATHAERKKLWAGTFKSQGAHTAMQKHVACELYAGPDKLTIHTEATAKKDRDVEFRQILSAQLVSSPGSQSVHVSALTRSGPLATKRGRPAVALRCYQFSQPESQPDDDISTQPSALFERLVTSISSTSTCRGMFHLESPHKIVRASRRFMVIVNPISGRRRGRAVWETVQGLFGAANISTHVVFTKRRSEATELVRFTDLSRLDGVIAVGGDGTLNEVITGLLTRARGCRASQGRWGGEGGPAELPPVGVIPAGTDCASAKYITHLNPMLAAQAIINNAEWRPLDVMLNQWRQSANEDVQQRFSVCATAWGIPGQVARDSESLRDTWGVRRYAVSIAKNLLSLRPVRGSVRIQAVGLEDAACTVCKAGCGICANVAAVSGKAGKAFGANTGRCAGSGQSAQGPTLTDREVSLDGEFLFACCFKCERTLTPFTHAADGCMDVIVMRALSQPKLMTLALQVASVSPEQRLALLQAYNEKAPNSFYFYKARAVTIAPEREQDTFNIDGEVGQGVATHVSILPAAINVFFAPG